MFCEIRSPNFDKERLFNNLDDGKKYADETLVKASKLKAFL